jgi:lysophospholipase L1-like esterase
MTLTALPVTRASATRSLRFVALGDSITTGLGDGISMGHRGTSGSCSSAGSRLAGRGWTEVLRPALGRPGEPTASLLNLACTGAGTADLVRHQLPAALAERPDVASVVAGMNDLLRRQFDVEQVRRDLTDAVTALRGEDAIVLMLRYPDPAAGLRVPGALRAILRQRVALLNDVVDDVGAADPGVLVLDLASDPRCRTASTWDVDRTHPSSFGHRLLAQGFAELLSRNGFPMRSVPDPGPAPAAAGTLAHGHWLMRYGLPWLLCRLLR